MEEVCVNTLPRPNQLLNIDNIFGVNDKIEIGVKILSLFYLYIIKVSSICETNSHILL